MKLIAGSSNPDLGAAIAKQLDLPLVDVEISTFANGEKRVWVKTPVRGENIVLVQAFSDPVDEHIMEFLLLTDALERMGARHINAVIPWMGYSRQDKVFREGEPIAAKVVANLVSNAYVKRAFMLDLHNSSTPGFFSIPTMHLSAMQEFVSYARKNLDLKHAIVASPDFGGLKRSRVFANHLELELINMDKQRNLDTGEISAVSTHGNVTDREVLIFDDCILSGGTMIEAAEILKQRGAKAVHCFATHGVFCNNAEERLQKSVIDSIIVSNSVEQLWPFEKLKTIDVSHLFAHEIKDWL